MDPGYKMLEAANAGVDAIIADSLAELVSDFSILL
jgi:hypothetical protein